MILSVISTSNCHRLNSVIKMATVHLLPTLHCFCPECIMWWPCVFKLPSLIWYLKVGGSTDGPCDWTPSGHPHTLHMSKERACISHVSQHNTVLVEKSLKHRMCNLHVCRPTDPCHVFVGHMHQHRLFIRHYALWDWKHK